MSIVAWHAPTRTMAADRRAVNGGLARPILKIWEIEGCLVGGVGEADLIAEMVAWYMGGRQPDKFPKRQADTGDAALLVVSPAGVVMKYEKSPYPIVFQPMDYFAVGSGRDYAMAAMHLGRDALEAVEVACALDVYCGDGIDSLTFSS